jgi:predicted ABC-type ATPase
VVIAGPNGAGKSTAAPALLKVTLQVSEFVNADTIAQGLSAFNPGGAAISAGRIMLKRLKELAAARESFAFETTLASRTFTPWIADLIADGYAFQLIYLWLPSPELAVERVAERVSSGGHNVPEEVIRRRYRKGIANFSSLYQPLATHWYVYDNSQGIAPRFVAGGSGVNEDWMFDPLAWDSIKNLK